MPAFPSQFPWRARRLVALGLVLLAPAASVAGETTTSGPPVAAAIAAPAPHAFIREPAPRPQPASRVQTRFAEKAHRWQLFAGAEYLARGDFYISPGMRLGAAYYLNESLGVELQLSHYWSSLNASAEQVVQTLGAIPDSRPPTWLGLAGARYSIGYGKVLIHGGVIHLEPQAFAHAGIHDYGGDVEPTGDLGVGLLVFLMPRLFVRADMAATIERESRSDQGVLVVGFLPALIVGGVL